MARLNRVLLYKNMIILLPENLYQYTDEINAWRADQIGRYFADNNLNAFPSWKGLYFLFYYIWSLFLWDQFTIQFAISQYCFRERLDVKQATTNNDHGIYEKMKIKSYIIYTGEEYIYFLKFQNVLQITLHILNGAVCSGKMNFISLLS